METLAEATKDTVELLRSNMLLEEARTLYASHRQRFHLEEEARLAYQDCKLCRSLRRVIVKEVMF